MSCICKIIRYNGPQVKAHLNTPEDEIMSQIENVVSRITFTGKQLLSHSADLIEWSANKNLAVAGDVAKFAVEQMRLPVQAESFAGFQKDVRNSYGKFGGDLKTHGYRRCVARSPRSRPKFAKSCCRSKSRSKRRPRSPAATKKAA